MPSGRLQEQGHRALEFLEIQPVKGEFFLQAGDLLRCLLCLARGRQRLVPLGNQLGLRAAIGHSQGFDQVGDSQLAGADGFLELHAFLLGVLECLFRRLEHIFRRRKNLVGNHFFRAMRWRRVLRRAADRASLPLAERQGEARSLAGNPGLPGLFELFPAEQQRSVG